MVYATRDSYQSGGYFPYSSTEDLKEILSARIGTLQCSAHQHTCPSYFHEPLARSSCLAALHQPSTNVIIFSRLFFLSFLVFFFLSSLLPFFPLPPPPSLPYLGTICQRVPCTWQFRCVTLQLGEARFGKWWKKKTVASSRRRKYHDDGHSNSTVWWLGALCHSRGHYQHHSITSGFCGFGGRT